MGLAAISPSSTESDPLSSIGKRHERCGGVTSPRERGEGARLRRCNVSAPFGCYGAVGYARRLGSHLLFASHSTSSLHSFFHWHSFYHLIAKYKGGALDSRVKEIAMSVAMPLPVPNRRINLLPSRSRCSASCGARRKSGTLAHSRHRAARDSAFDQSAPINVRFQRALRDKFLSN
jgi:hypothetical protein